MSFKQLFTWGNPSDAIPHPTPFARTSVSLEIGRSAPRATVGFAKCEEQNEKRVLFVVLDYSTPLTHLGHEALEKEIKSRFQRKLKGVITLDCFSYWGEHFVLTIHYTPPVDGHELAEADGLLSICLILMGANDTDVPPPVISPGFEVY